MPLGELSDLQRAVVDADVASLSVIAAAGSGKTRAAVARLVELRSRLDSERGRVALLSFSNAAVNEFTFRHREALQHVSRRHPFQERVSIQTVDSFVVGSILTPHGHRVMGCDRTPFLVENSQPFLDGFKYWVASSTRDYPVCATTIRVQGLVEEDYSFWHDFGSGAPLEVPKGGEVTARLGAVGAYTHGTTQYWGLRCLRSDLNLARVVARRFPHIIVDEAQDLQPGHVALLSILAKSGSSVSLFGDPNQAIYEFAGADGCYLRNHDSSKETDSYKLSVNYRSTPAIVSLSNNVSGQSHTSERSDEPTDIGTFYFTYNTTDPLKAVEKFRTALHFHGICAANSAVLCRGASMVDSLRHGEWKPPGKGVVAELARATRFSRYEQGLCSSIWHRGACRVEATERSSRHLRERRARCHSTRVSIGSGVSYGPSLGIPRRDCLRVG